MEPFGGKIGEKVSFHHMVEIKQPNAMTGPEGNPPRMTEGWGGAGVLAALRGEESFLEKAFPAPFTTFPQGVLSSAHHFLRIEGEEEFLLIGRGRCGDTFVLMTALTAEASTSACRSCGRRYN